MTRYYIQRNERDEYETIERATQRVVDVTRNETNAMIDCATRNRMTR